MATSLISSIQTISGNQPRIRDIPEAATQTFLSGTPVALNASGNVIAWAGSIVTTLVGSIIGIAKNPGKNLTTAGTAQQLSQGSVPNQPSAQNIQRPYFDPDGNTLLETADPDTIFVGQVGPAESVTQANVGVPYGISIDTDNHWYVDTAKVTVGTNTCVMIVKLDPNDQAAVKRGVYFRFIVGYVQPIA
jgi:hypothetical protein